MSNISGEDLAKWRVILRKCLSNINQDFLKGLLYTFNSCRYGSSKDDKAIDEECKVYLMGETLQCDRFASRLVDDKELLQCTYDILQAEKDDYDHELTPYNTLLQKMDELLSLQNGKKPTINPNDLAGAWAEDDKDYYIIDQNEKISKAHAHLSNCGILIILEDKNNKSSRLLGILTETDISKSSDWDAPVSKIMVTRIIKFNLNTHMKELQIRLIEKNDNPKIKRLIIVNLDGSFLGVVSEHEINSWRMGNSPTGKKG